MIDFFQAILNQFIQTSLFEWFAFVIALLQIVFSYFNKKINFYFGALSSSLYSILFFQFALYAESLLNIYYLVASIAGLIYWKSSDQIIQISYSTRRYWIRAFIVFFVSFGILYVTLFYFSDSNVPFFDAFVSALAWAGTYLLVLRKIENWIWLSISNMIAIPLMCYKSLQLTALLISIYLVLGIMGFFKWKKEIKSKTFSI
ncbi:MAG: nicotinamide riboside transporter PnuC [Chitinophagaceae bacterium]